ncbi:MULTISPECIES: hypothetical protein [unclassified Paenibacillus]|uniref:hypothetical protein n=1 Tax=unclassified Paenibacillus TaxID=185978 RepID=UPI000CFD85C3|nr:MULTISPECIES: hypothetical protein [unclassified Paenibacillus]PRA07534.1 hypothetical protein CQ043_09095 [Paenibacillus sp. MYb63]PRA51179.1 hypothetical protein CQ061_02250 [Paenibacillus sp. MYb67]QZN74306.1 hypothetical protein K5K90_23215 [Paenibacillus sp. DR312]
MRKSWGEFVFYLAVFFFVLFMTGNDYSLFWTIGVVSVTILFAFIKHVFYPLVFDKRIDRLESFLSKQQNTPGTYIIYVLANRLDDEVELVMEQIMQKYKRRTTQAQFKAAYGLYRKDMFAIRQAVPYIGLSDYRTYYESILLLEDGKSEEARERLQSIKKQWMRSTLLAGLELKAENRDTAIQHAHEALNSSRGVNRYVLYKEYERVLPEVVGHIS